MTRSFVHPNYVFRSLFGLALLELCAQHPALAQQVNLGAVQTTGENEAEAPAVESAPYQAPTKAPLEAIQPTVEISQQFIEANMPLASNYSDIVAIAPSVYAVSPNGPGLSEAQILNIRGFQDGQYNVTFDGIPWNDSNDFTHHSTSYFMDHDQGPLSLDLGPGTAATIGDANFCCTISTTSKEPLSNSTFTPYVSYGSFNTRVFGTEYDSGAMTKYNGAKLMIDVESLASDGYLSNMGLSRQNAFAKLEQPLGGNTVVTVVAMYNQLKQYISLGSTAAQINAFGPAYGLNNNPNSQAYWGYNRDEIHSDFEYIGIKSELDGGWSIDNKAYTYAYFHDGFNGEDPNGETPNGTYYNTIGYVNPGAANGLDVPGQYLVNYYRSYGDTFRLKKTLPFGDVQTGIWFDEQINTRRLTEEDFTLGNAYNPINIGNAILGIDRELRQTLTTVQPYVQVDWNALPGLTLSPGVRYDYFRRDVDAQVNVKSGEPQSYANSFDSPLPSFLVHYQINSSWTAYAQVAKGFLAPNENFFNFGTGVNSSQTTLKPQETWSYQAGTNWQSQRLALGFDIYYVDFNNLIVAHTVSGVTTYSNLGGASYKGVEGQGTYYLGSGFSLYANGSVNPTNSQGSGTPLPGAPTAMASLGVIYNMHGWYASLLDKFVGDLYGDVDRQIPISHYNVLNGSLNYTFRDGAPDAPSIKLSFNNLLDTKKIYALAGYTASAGTPLYWTIPGFGVLASVSVPF